jgi:hypothetical protein
MWRSVRVARMRDKMNAYKSLVGIPEEMEYLEELRLDK